MHPKDRLNRLERKLPAERSAFVTVRCEGAGCWEAMGEAERAAMIAAELGRPSRDTDFVIALQRVPSGQRPEAA